MFELLGVLLKICLELLGDFVLGPEKLVAVLVRLLVVKEGFFEVSEELFLLGDVVETDDEGGDGVDVLRLVVLGVFLVDIAVELLVEEEL